MSAPESLKDVYADEIKDLWSANDQMAKVVKAMAAKAHDPELKKTLESSVDGINAHAESIKSLLEKAGEDVEPEHCKGMEGLVKEAKKHIGPEAPEAGELLDLVLLSQYQRMSHYGLAGFGTAEAYAQSLGMKDHVSKLKSIVADIYKADEYASKIGERAAKLAKKLAA